MNGRALRTASRQRRGEGQPGCLHAVRPEAGASGPAGEVREFVSDEALQLRRRQRHQHRKPEHEVRPRRAIRPQRRDLHGADAELARDLDDVNRPGVELLTTPVDQIEQRRRVGPADEHTRGPVDPHRQRPEQVQDDGRLRDQRARGRHVQPPRDGAGSHHEPAGHRQHGAVGGDQRTPQQHAVGTRRLRRQPTPPVGADLETTQIHALTVANRTASICPPNGVVRADPAGIEGMLQKHTVSPSLSEIREHGEADQHTCEGIASVGQAGRDGYTGVSASRKLSAAWQRH